MKRVLTGVFGATLVVLALFGLDSRWFFWFCAGVFLVATYELMRILRCLAPRAPLWPLLATVPAIALILFRSLAEEAAPAGHALAEVLGFHPSFVVCVALSVGVGLMILLSKTPIEETLFGAGGLAFGSVYLAVPLASIAELHHLDPKVLLLGLSIVWVGDAAALYAGKAFGRHKMAPVVSPNKTWEGAAASLLSGLIVAAVWSWLVLGKMELPVLVAGGATSFAGQAGDLFESMLKRSAGVKDSGALLPGHGGVLDRIDALLFGAPVLLLSWWFLSL